MARAIWYTTLSVAVAKPARFVAVVASSAATRCLACPAMLLKLPAAYTVDAVAAMPETRLFALGAQGRSAPVAVVNAAIRLRVTPPTVVKSPPT